MDSKDKSLVVITSKSQTQIRWIILILVNIILFGDYYCYDNPAALKTQIGDRMGNPDDYETLFSLMYTLYSFPNIVLPFFSGYFIDTYGVFVCMLAFTIFEIVGQTIFATGLTLKSWPVMLLGRLIYGFGGGSLSVGVSAIISVWFSGQELALAFGLNTAIARVGSVANNMASPSIASTDGVVFAVWIGTILLAINLTCVLLTRYFDRKVEHSISTAVFIPLLQEDDITEYKISEIHQQQQSPNSINQDDDDNDTNVLLKQQVANTDSSKEHKKVKPSIWSVRHFPHIFWIIVLLIILVYGCISPFNNILSSLLLERDYFIENPTNCHLTNSNACESLDNPPISVCPTSQWYQPPLPFNMTPNDIDCTVESAKDACETSEYCDRLTDGELKAAAVMSIPFLISVCLIPFVGWFVDTFGLRGVVVALPPAILIVVHSFLGATNVDPVGPLVGQGIAYSLFAGSVWPSIPLVIDEQHIGLAYGATFSGLNIGFTVLPLLIAQIYSNSNDHYIPNVEYFIVGMASAGLLVALYLNYFDYYHLQSVLNKAQSKRKQ